MKKIRLGSRVDFASFWGRMNQNLSMFRSAKDRLLLEQGERATVQCITGCRIGDSKYSVSIRLAFCSILELGEMVIMQCDITLYDSQGGT